MKLYKIRYLVLSLLFLVVGLFVLYALFISNRDAIHEYVTSTNKQFVIDKKHYQSAGYKRSAEYMVFGKCLEDGKRYTINVTPQCYMDMQIPSNASFNISYEELERYTGRYDYKHKAYKYFEPCYNMLPLLIGTGSIIYIVIFMMYQPTAKESGWKPHTQEHAAIHKTYYLYLCLCITWLIVFINIGIWVKEIIICF